MRKRNAVKPREQSIGSQGHAEMRSREDRDQLQGCIARRAYEIYLARGRGDDHALDDWLHAECEVLKERASAD